MLLRRIARPLLSTVFIGQGLEALRAPRAAADAAQPTVQGLRRLPSPVAGKIPDDAQGVAMITAAVQIGGGLLLASGRMPRLASAALTFTVIPGNLGAHMFWNEDDPERKAEKRRAFLADVSLLGGLMIAAADTAGKPSLGWRGRQAARRVSAAVTSALPAGGADTSLVDSQFGEKLGQGLQVGAERGRELISAAGEKSGPLVEAARRRGGELAELARERGGELAELARERGGELAELARERGSEFAHALPRSVS
ncbi:DoxX family protein [Mycobacterium talmoniae]|uniref:DoxX family protein n=1 Tax=Mycobacterium talmoniae TaxID=1858794 RepID=A0A1S1NNJ3_9MYCO|nr:MULTISPECIES: DoxX family protein [Mycobacterium]OHV05888.1 DoxX family protein [Mycobacterium talmoniae]TDH57793.1 DoxX family protein [Mycobacterium eburneum]